MVPKKDGTLRPILDFREVNEKSFTDKYSVREVSDCLNDVGREHSTIFMPGSGMWILADGTQGREPQMHCVQDSWQRKFRMEQSSDGSVGIPCKLRQDDGVPNDGLAGYHLSR